MEQKINQIILKKKLGNYALAFSKNFIRLNNLIL